MNFTAKAHNPVLAEDAPLTVSHFDEELKDSTAIEKLRSAYSLARATVARVMALDQTQEKLILVIAGSSKDTEMIKESLREEDDNYKVWNASNNEVAQEIADSIEPRLIIADWQTLKQSKPGWITQLMTSSGRNNIPTLLLTDGTLSLNNMNGHSIGAEMVDFIRKPVDPSELKARVRLLVNLSDQVEHVRRENHAIQTELDMKHRELSLHLELLMHSGSVKDKFLDGIARLQPYLNNEGKSRLRYMVKQFRWALSDEASVNFERAFDDLNATLYAQLEEICPKITKNEKRLCAFVLKDHSASDIARTTGKSQNSINVAFARLRSKLNIANNKDLKTFLSGLTKLHCV